MDSTPLRRVPLASLDPNTTNTNASSFVGSSSPIKKTIMQSPLQKLGEQMMQTRTPPETEVKKRSLGKGVESSPTTSRVASMPQEEEEERVVKKARLSYSRSPSPAPSHASSVFSSPPIAQNSQEQNDESENDISQATTLTTPDVPPVAPVTLTREEPTPIPTTRPRLTCEQARQKAEILRLRLGLANYKVKTGQTDVSLDQLERRQMLQQWGQQPKPQPQPQRLAYQQQHSRQYSQEMPPPSRIVSHQRSSSGAGFASSESGNGNWRGGLWEVMRRREQERQERERERQEREQERQERETEDKGEETEEEGELELPRLPQQQQQQPTSPLQGGDRGVEAVSGLLSLARG